MNPKDLGDVPSGLPGYLLWSLSLGKALKEALVPLVPSLPPTLELIPSWPSASPSILYP